MSHSTTTLESIKFRKDFSYSKKTPTLVSNSVSCYDEIARWYLDINGILYKDEPHAPGLYVPVTNKLTGNKTGLWNNPVFVSAGALIYTVEGILQYVDPTLEPEERLIPEEHKERVTELYVKFHKELTDPLSKYVYSLILPNRKYGVPLFTARVPFKERLIFKLGYPILKKAIAKGLKIDEQTKEERLNEVNKVFDFVGEQLSDGRKYLVGDRLTIADICFCAISAPIILPDQFGASITNINEIPDELRQKVLELRATPAGQFVLRMYREHRGKIRNQEEILKEPGALARINQRVKGAIFGSNFQVKLYSMLQKRFPVLKIWFTNLVVINAHELVVEALQRDEDFTIEEINAKKMSALNDSFFLGMDRNNPLFEQERNFVRKASRREDMDVIRTFVTSHTKAILERTKPLGKLDVANELTRSVMTKLVSSYFGVKAEKDAYMKEWLRAIFWDLFLNLGNDASIHAKGKKAADGMKALIERTIRDRKEELQGGKVLEDNVLNRFILMQAGKGNEWFNDDAIRRNISGIITGALETTNKSVILVLDELFRRPKVLKDAIRVANENDMKGMYGYVSEALRFNPHQPLLMRYTENEQSLTGRGKNYTIPAKSKVFATISAAAFDPAAFPEPKKFDPARTSVYMNYGFALHECYGKYINMVTITEFVAAVLRLPNVRRSTGTEGQGTGLMEGPFPNNFVVEFG